ncbi:M48 family metallopeptidase [Pikeienuella piscinae]|uniref:M48 family metallopeptidase n=1 Tax=Pikeienuella piscinae TaxID=2748098 RepID=A0A7L5C3K3_9RHOB|nr:M48 family metallopeptidase [Pikeienuella piscinae]QIE56439.1 M48 family metallopeptidase [Pikeienuella piscinae]
MAAPVKYDLLEAPGRYFDGRTAAARDVVVKFGDASLILMTHEDMPITHWSLAGLRDLGAGAGALSLTPDYESDERLVLDDPDMVAAIRQVCPALGLPRPVSRSRWRRAIVWAAAALGSVYVIVFHLAPALSDRMAALIPPEAEIAMGEEMATQFAMILSKGEPRFCAGGAGGRALATLTARLEGAADAHLPLTVRVLDHPMVNAFALPGGQIILFRGLLRNADSPEALAGVLAHEIGHVAARDPTRLTLRSAGTAGMIGLLLGDFTGATVTVALSEALLRSGYQREAEAAADDYAAKLLAAEGLPTAPLAGFFRKLKGEKGDGAPALSHLSSHPDLDGRAAEMRAADTIGDAPYEPALSDQDWVALRNICR